MILFEVIKNITDICYGRRPLFRNEHDSIMFAHEILAIAVSSLLIALLIGIVKGIVV